MKAVTAAKLAIIASLLLGLVLPSAALADTKPYLKVRDGDVFAGGWFNNQNSSCSTADGNYQAPSFNPTANQYAGGILTYGTSSRTGSSVDLGAFALGLIEGSPADTYGFYSGLTTNASGVSSLNFSGTNNATGKYWGGYFGGDTPQVHCIADYYGTKQSSPTTLGSNSFNIGQLANDQYKAPVGQTSDITAGGDAIIGLGENITVFVDGNVYISHNITYDPPHKTTDVPKLAIVVKGNIYIAPSVTRIDGLYIAQPDLASGATIKNTGNIWTCHDNSATAPDGTWLHTNCATTLTVNGALIAKQVNLVRINGDINTGSGNITPAEIVNYTPQMVIGGPFFNQDTSNNFTVNSIISLPPVF